MASMEMIFGVAIVVAALWLGWAARATATGPVRRFAMLPWIEEYFVIFILTVILAGVVLIAVAAGVA
jgi:hypothetical protein